MSMLQRLATALFGAALVPAAAGAEAARDWIAQAKNQPGAWRDLGEIELSSGRIFIGDTSWGDDYHMRGAHDVPAPALQAWVHVDPAHNQVNALWLAAPDSDGPPARIVHRHSFGMDSAYFAVGDATVGQAIADLRNRDTLIAGAEDGFELFLSHIQDPDFIATWVPVPPDAGRALAVGTRADGGAEVVWTVTAAGTFRGILIDVTGTRADGTYIDTLLPQD